MDKKNLEQIANSIQKDMLERPNYGRMSREKLEEAIKYVDEMESKMSKKSRWLKDADVHGMDGITLHVFRVLLSYYGYHYQTEKASHCTTDYWIRDDKEEVVAIVYSCVTYGVVPLITEKSLCESIGWKSICLRPKVAGIAPYVNIDGKKEYLHILLMKNKNALLQIDHKFHTRLCVLKDVLRLCTGIENGYNRADRRKKQECNKGFYFFHSRRVSTLKDMTVLKEKGYTVIPNGNCKNNIPCYEVTSPQYKTVEAWKEAVDWYENYVYDDLRYKEEEDFTDSIHLMIHYYIFETISKDEMIKQNEIRKSGNADIA